MHRRVLRAPAALLTLALLATACGGDEEADPTPTPSATVVVEPSPSPSPSPSPTPEDVAALTGEPGAAPDVLERPAIAVKVENSSAARPQSGLDAADIVFEELTEGGITRFIAIFNSQLPERVGPVRSGRLIDAAVLPPFSPVLALSGARDEVVNAIRRGGIETLYDDGTDSLYFRDRTRRAPSNLYVAGTDLFEAAGPLAPPATAAFSYAAAAPAGAAECDDDDEDCEDPGAAIEVRMSRVAVAGWEYDSAEGLYRRSQNGQPFRVTGSGQVGAANVVVLGMVVGPGVCCDAAGNPLTRTDVVGSGRAIILRDGSWYEARWEKTSELEHIQLISAEGEPFTLKPGATWVHLAPRGNLPAAP